MSRAARFIAAGWMLGTAVMASAQAGRPQLQDPSHDTTTADVPGLSAATSLCRSSDDPAYGVTQENPIKVGGGAMYMASRQAKYLRALRGPAGQGLHFRRTGTKKQPDDTIVDVYAIEYPGLAKPTMLYLDGYHWSAPVAPAGWLCGAAIDLAPPGPDPFETQVQLRSLAVKMGERPVTAIPADPDGSITHGVIFDHVRLIALAARAAAAAGTPLDPAALPREVAQPRTIAVAFPLVCEGRTLVPLQIALTDRAGNAPRVVATAGDGQLAALIPGVDLPPGSIAIGYGVAGLVEGASVSVRYAEPCGTSPSEVKLPVKSERGRIITGGAGITPPGVSVPAAGAQVRVQVFLDADGTPLLPAYVSGPTELAAAAIEAARTWRVVPPRMNGAPLLTTTTLAIDFRP